ncbi:hypothetical protein KSP40_PGU004178 [Platanthera guangdongensis]|uniref:Uncharacterized protein n=1 Tax=Platanthera guangdongensis TaxID=2320717 RepID=A0ABR2MHN1_9ASPA
MDYTFSNSLSPFRAVTLPDVPSSLKRHPTLNKEKSRTGSDKPGNALRTGKEKETANYENIMSEGARSQQFCHETDRLKSSYDRL